MQFFKQHNNQQMQIANIHASDLNAWNKKLMWVDIFEYKSEFGFEFFDERIHINIYRLIYSI